MAAEVSPVDAPAIPELTWAARSRELVPLRDYAWQYFLAHAQARLTTFRFYIVFCTIVGTGLIAVLSREGATPQMGSPLAFALAFLSFVYWRIDARHRTMIKRAEAALRWIENATGIPDSDGEPHPLKLFERDEYLTARLHRFPRAIGRSAFFSYSTCVNMVFGLFGIGGCATGVVLLALWR